MFCGDKWSLGHKYNNHKSNKHEDERQSNTSISKSNDDKKKERKTNVINVVKIGFKAIYLRLNNYSLQNC